MNGDDKKKIVINLIYKVQAGDGGQKSEERKKVAGAKSNEQQAEGAVVTNYISNNQNNNFVFNHTAPINLNFYEEVRKRKSQNEEIDAPADKSMANGPEVEEK